MIVHYLSSAETPPIPALYLTINAHSGQGWVILRRMKRFALPTLVTLSRAENVAESLVMMTAELHVARLPVTSAFHVISVAEAFLGIVRVR